VTPSAMDERLLVFDCHEAWAYQLQALPYPMDVVVGLRGRQNDGWDEGIRPAPRNARLVRLDEVLRTPQKYQCIIANNLTDLLDAKSLAGPRLLVVHETLDGALREQGSGIPAHEFRTAVSQYVRMTGTHVVAVSKLKGRSWGFEEDIVPLSADPAAYLPWSGDLARGLRVANHIHRRPRILLWEFHKQAFGDLPVTLVGKNSDLSGVQPSANWDDLKETFRRHRFYIHTADPALEDGYNMATLEAMAAGLPIVGNCHPTSPVEHGVSGFLSDDAMELRGYAERLLADRELAGRMGQAGRKTVAEYFSGLQFREGFSRSIECARQKWQDRASLETFRVSQSSF
jgi:glycosyltransferase involved in cell wall biosynthesis